MKKVRIGVLGAFRGGTMINYCKLAKDVELTAICDKVPELLERQRKKAEEEGLDITFYESFDDFIQHDMDAVILANYANEHAPFAIRAMKSGKHVFSEVLPCQTMKEAVELIEAVEETGKIYAYGENYCYMDAPYEMKKLYEKGVIGELEYAEGEYIHNCEPIWPNITYGEEDHWRNNMYSTFYCTHSLGPVIHITGLRPVSVTGFEGTKVERVRRCGGKGGSFAIEMVTLENGAIVKSIHGGLYKNSIWYTVYGEKGRMECAREDAQAGHIHKIYLNRDKKSGDYESSELESYEPTHLPEGMTGEELEKFGHGGSDFYSMYHFVEKIKGNPEADTIDVYEAMDMFLPGMFAYRSVLKGGIPVEVPNLRDKEVREQWRNDTACTVPSVAGDQLLPTYSLGTPVIEKEVYDRVAALWEERKSGKLIYGA